MSPRVSIKPSDVGKRVTVQYFKTDGSREEAVGILERAAVVDGSVILGIRKKDDSLVEVPLRNVSAGKVVG